MIVYNGVPLTFFQDDGFRLLNGNFAKNLKIQLGLQAIRSMVLKKFEEEKSKLKESLSGALVSINGVTRRILTESLDFDHTSWVFQCNVTMKNTVLQ